MPSSYQRLVSEHCHTGALELWTKVHQVNPMPNGCRSGTIVRCRSTLG